MDEQSEKIGRLWTVSIAVPSSIVDNAQSAELKSYLVGQIARSLVIFKIDEIIIYDEYCIPGTPEQVILDKRKESMVQAIRILEYLECPQYLRRQLFPIQKYLQYAGLLNPLEAPNHLSSKDQCPYREGIVLNKPHKQGSFVNIGLKQDCQVDRSVQPNVRVTVKLEPNSKKLRGKIVSPSEPREKLGLYWGYSIRMANSLSEVFDGCPYEGGYDLKIGTSDKGDNVDKTIKKIPFTSSMHSLIVFGGLRGIESAHESDESLSHVQETSELFDYYLNTCPNQGSDTIRTEEAILITLSVLRRRLFKQRI
ncbi:28S rRNA (uridine-N(3))-methyltransferase isoform X1 [Dermatophagoides pteronyssinus]|uniref:28S rRNA (uridine-N(3))-methyltransferase isoform X1 n=1 Tax=Dermatophagoides pteronyssinus TaxID=6956 RepID=UPI003F681215